MAMFKRPEQQVDNGNGKPPVRSKWQGIIDHMDAAHKHMSEAMNMLSLINFDLQRGADFIAKYRESLVNTIQEAGGQVEPNSVEEQIRDYIPKALQRERVDEANQQ